MDTSNLMNLTLPLLLSAHHCPQQPLSSPSSIEGLTHSSSISSTAAAHQAPALTTIDDGALPSLPSTVLFPSLASPTCHPGRLPLQVPDPAPSTFLTGLPRGSTPMPQQERPRDPSFIPDARFRLARIGHSALSPTAMSALIVSRGSGRVEYRLIWDLVRIQGERIPCVEAACW